MTQVNTVLGPVDADSLGVVSSHDTLLSVYPGAQYGFDIEINRADIFATLKHKLLRFKDAGGSTIVDSSGMFHGRDVYMYESLQEATGINIIASTGLGPEALLGGYFLTPQTNPPTPWPAEKFEELFAAEVTEGMVEPRIERRAGAGLITTTGTRAGLTATDESLFKGAARASAATGAACSFRFGADPIAEVELILAEGVEPGRVRLSGVDRNDVSADQLKQLAETGVFLGFDQVGESAPVDKLLSLIEAGHRDQILLASNSVGVAIGHEAPNDTSFVYLLEEFVPQLREAGLSDEDITALTITNPRTWLAGK